MSEKITDLAPEQEEKLAEYRDRWISLGLSTQKIDREKAAAAVDLVYSCAGLNPPKIKIWLRSPYEGVIGAWWLKQVLKTLRGKTLDKVRTKIVSVIGDKPEDKAGEQVGDQLRTDIMAQAKTRVRNHIGSQIGAQVKNQIGEPVKDQVRDRVWSHVWNQAKDHVRPQLGDPIWTQVWAQVWNQIWDQVWAQKPQIGEQIGEQVRAEIVAQVRDQFKGQIEDLLSTQAYCAGLHDANMLAPYEFFGKEMGVDVDKLSGLMAATEHCGWFWPFGGAVIITEKPTELHRDNRNRLHNEKGMAVKYSDGWGVGVWYGTRVENWVITNPEQITIDKILDEKDAGARRVMRERFGLQDFFFAMIKDGTAKRVSRRKDPSGQPMSLYRYDDKETLLHFVHVYNGEAETDGTRHDFIISCKNVCDDAWDSMVGTYPDLINELKDNPRKFEIIKASIR